MRLSKRAKAALKALRNGQHVDMSTWPRDEALAVIRAAKAEQERVRCRLERAIKIAENELGKLRQKLVVVEADIATLRAFEELLERAAGQAG